MILMLERGNDIREQPV